MVAIKNAKELEGIILFERLIFKIIIIIIITCCNESNVIPTSVWGPSYTNHIIIITNQ